MRHNGSEVEELKSERVLNFFILSATMNLNRYIE